MKTATGIVKFYLNQTHPDFELYMTPVQINPKDPAFVISSPDDYIRELANEIGYFYTLGMPEDTKAIEEGRSDEEAFITMCDEIVEEQERMLWFELDRFKEGLLASAFFSTDRIQHIFWVARDKAHPLYDNKYAEKYGHVIDDYYRKMDRILGEVMRRVDDKTAVMVFSDHGFSSFRRTVHINSWLVQNGLMALTRKVSRDDKDGGGLFQYVDWKIRMGEGFFSMLTGRIQRHMPLVSGVYILILREGKGRALLNRGQALIPLQIRLLMNWLN
jgi:predicted AlkP superfamily phosphohydrolase/phosphomutase